MEHAAALRAAYETTGAVVAGVRENQYSWGTPCAEWDVRELLVHLVGGAVLFGLAGRREDPPDPNSNMPDLLGDNPVTAYRTAAESCAAAWAVDGALDGTTRLPWGEFPAHLALGLALTEVVVHGWDLATATDQTLLFPDEIIQLTDATVKILVPTPPVDDENFGTAVEISAGASPLMTLVAYLGRTA